MSFKALLAIPVLVATLLTSVPAQAETTATEERFQDLFITAGYCSAFGAAFGTALLAFTTEPAENLRYVAVGASLGFIGGTALGSYIIFSPMVASEGTQKPALALGANFPSHGVVIRPTIDAKTHGLTSIEGGLTLAQF
jgi:hypothetical protein